MGVFIFVNTTGRDAGADGCPLLDKLKVSEESNKAMSSMLKTVQESLETAQSELRVNEEILLEKKDQFILMEQNMKSMDSEKTLKNEEIVEGIFLAHTNFQSTFWVCASVMH